jgi:hypothetical protein
MTDALPEPTAPLTAAEAAAAIHGIRTARDAVNSRAAALSWMMWALVITSLATSVLLFSYFEFMSHGDAFGDMGWGLFLLGNALIMAVWAAVGGLFQHFIWEAFTVTSGVGEKAWKSPLLAFGTAFGLVVLNLFLQAPFRFLAGAHTDAQLNHNVSLEVVLSIGGSVLVAITLLQGARGVPRRPGILAGVVAMLVGHLSILPFVPDAGAAGSVAAIALVPISFVGVGSYYWRRG